VTCAHSETLFVLEGTRPHAIRPRRVQALPFEVSRHVVFSAKVRHPGTQANNLLRRALREGRRAGH
jgi:hypothetical protein